MNINERIRLCLILEEIKKNQDAAKKLGLINTSSFEHDRSKDSMDKCETDLLKTLIA